LLPIDVETGTYKVGEISMKALSASASLAKNGSITISLANVHATEKMQASCDLGGVKIKDIKGKILTAPAINSYNSFDNPQLVKSESFNEYKIDGSKITVQMPEKSIITLYVQQD
jgi:alpha-N-arabinofuranosidase